MLAVVWTLKKFRVYLGREFTLMTDHKAIEGIMNKKETTPRLTRLRMAIQEYKFKIKHINGKDNIFADYLSRPILAPEICINEIESQWDNIVSIYEDL